MCQLWMSWPLESRDVLGSQGSRFHTKICCPRCTAFCAITPCCACSAGCASGEEAYTLAIVFDAEGLGDRGQNVASEISGAALKRWSAGQYRDWSLRSLPAELRALYFHSEAGLHIVPERLRNARGADVRRPSEALVRELCAKTRDKIDLMLTDVLMPDMSGPMLARQLRAARPDMKLIYLDVRLLGRAAATAR
jgi:CheY-like chemotaxis protein